MNALTSLSALQDAVNALPSVAAGKVRVFRGQTTDYKAITPALYRKHLRFQQVWNIYARFLLRGMKQDSGELLRAQEEWQIQLIWLEAVAQHYGSGSAYLDVSHSVECAAWFALHRGEFETESTLLPSTGLARPPQLTRNWLEYSRAVEPGYLYAFDVDRWDPSELTPPDLALVDLGNAPGPFKTPRMLAQSGCLIRVGQSEQYDLRCRCVESTPLRIAWPMTGSEIVKRKVEEMFPGPADDSWYRRFLSAPFMPDVNEATGEIVFKRPVPVTVYRDKSGETSAYKAALIATEHLLTPPLLHYVLEHLPLRTDAPKDVLILMSRATPIVLEAPLLHVFPSPSDNLWNHELLVSDLCDTVATYSNAGQETGNVSVLNVLFQFGPLEDDFWERTSTSHETIRVTRGLWLFFQPPNFRAALFFQDVDCSNSTLGPLQIQPPEVIRLDPVKRRIQKLEGKTEWVELWTQLAKPVFVALTLLRALNPRLKAEAMPVMYILPERNDSTVNNTYIASVYADAARLARIRAPEGVADWFFLRDRQNDPFTANATKTSPYLLIETTAAYSDLPASVIHNLIPNARSTPSALEAFSAECKKLVAVSAPGRNVTVAFGHMNL